jgi:hypothetical protein
LSFTNGLFGLISAGALRRPIISARAPSRAAEMLLKGDRSRQMQGSRLSVEELLPDGNPDMAIEIVDRLIDEVPIDVIHVTHSAYIMWYSLGTQMTDMTFR